ncbi:MAG: hypothetical protein NWE92_01765 [Candidatus Bathyarchaeota archaeon]|nr:hypothetical protein [Candidatus Bathyarchaeota archaeon]
MQVVKNKNIAFLITLFLMLTITGTSIFVALPTTEAHDPPVYMPTNAYVSCTPPVIGLGQNTVIVVWLDRTSPTSTGTSGQHFAGFLLTITDPDGINSTIGPWSTSGAMASDFKTFTPTKLGNYSIVFSWPGAVIEASDQPYVNTQQDVGDIWMASTSKPCTLTVNEDQVPQYPEPPLPTDYWTRPITNINRNWNVLASNWLQGTWLQSNIQTVGTGPMSAHVLWARPILPAFPGGIADANYGNLNANIEDYLSPWGGCIIMNGIIYYNTPQNAETPRYGYYAVDLHTGEQIWYNNGTNPITMATWTGAGGVTSPTVQSYPKLTCGQMLKIDNVNGRGVASYLWEMGPATSKDRPGYTSWYMLDPSTGNLILTLHNVPSGTSATDAQGDLLIYTYNSATGNILCWNSTQAIPPGGPLGTGQQTWRPEIGQEIDTMNNTLFTPGSWSNSLDAATLAAISAGPLTPYSMNVTVAKNLRGSMTILKDETREPVGIFGSQVNSTYVGGTAAPTADMFTVWKVTINDHAAPYSPYPNLAGTLNNNLGFTATLDYNKDIAVPLPGHNYTWSVSLSGQADQAGVFFLRCTQTGQIWAYSLDTASPLWGPIEGIQGGDANDQMAYYGISATVYEDKVLVNTGYMGAITAYDVQTGNFLWRYVASAAPYSYESQYSANMPLSLGSICNGMIYTWSNEHSPTNPLWRQSYTRCVNATDGTLVWKLSTYMMFIGTPSAIADGYLVTASDYDNLIYCIGKGPSGTTVSAPQGGITEGNSFTITGTVTDQSPGALAFASKYGLMNGVAAVSDASQEDYMMYLYEQQVKPANATGVQVTLNALDPNGNFIDLGTATTDVNGFYYLQVDPNMLGAGAGTYKIIANFAGSESYGSSTAESAFTINSVAPTPTAAPVQAQPNTELYIIGGVIAIIIAIAIGFTITILVLRKRP